MTESLTADSLAWSANNAPLHIRQVTYDSAEDWCCVCFGGTTSDLSVVPDEEDAESTLFSGSIALRDILGVEVKDSKTPVLIVVRAGPAVSGGRVAGVVHEKKALQRDAKLSHLSRYTTSCEEGTREPRATLTSGISTSWRDPLRPRRPRHVVTCHTCHTALSASLPLRLGTGRLPPAAF